MIDVFILSRKQKFAPPRHIAPSLIFRPNAIVVLAPSFKKNIYFIENTPTNRLGSRLFSWVLSLT